MKRLLLLLSIAALLVAAPAFAQYMFVDADGDGDCDGSDLLDDTVTSIDIWVDTDNNPDGSPVNCVDGLNPMTILSYEFTLHNRGNVTWGAYTNSMATFTTPFLTASDAGDYHTGFGGTAPLAAGSYKLGTLTITVATGQTAVIAPVPSSGLDPNFFTAFGSECSGNDFDNTIKLGYDFMGTCGPSAPTPVRSTTWGAIKNKYK